MQTTLHIYRVGCARETKLMDLATRPGFTAINRVVLPLLEGAKNIEHVSVLHNGERRDMFVDELGALPMLTRPPLPVNEPATAIYHAASLEREPGADTSRWPKIHGTAVVFDRIVWF